MKLKIRNIFIGIGVFVAFMVFLEITPVGFWFEFVMELITRDNDPINNLGLSFVRLILGLIWSWLFIFKIPRELYKLLMNKLNLKR